MINSNPVGNSSERSPKHSTAALVSILLANFTALALLSFCAWSLKIPAKIALQSVPIPSDAEMRIDNRYWLDIGEDGPNTIILYRVNRPWTEVVSYYRQEMERGHWMLKEEQTKDLGDALFGSDHGAHIVCLVFGRSPGLVVNVQVSGTIENGNTLALTIVTIESSPNGKDFCR